MSRALEKMQQRADEAHDDLVKAISDHKAGLIEDEDLAEVMEYSAVRHMSLKILECMEEAEKGKNIEKWWELL